MNMYYRLIAWNLRGKRMKRSRVSGILSNGQSGYDVLVKGWVRTRRDSKGITFLEINDGSCMANLQVVVEGEEFPLTDVTTGAGIAIEGRVVESPAEGQSVEVRAGSITVYGNADPDTYPLQKKRHSFEYLREIAHLRPRTNTFGAVLRVRNVLARSIHGFFQDRGFQYVQTPIITASDCEGAGEIFTVTSLDLEKIPRKDGRIDYTGDFFGTKTGLTVSGQLEGELLALALGDIYTFGPTFRAENSNTSRHLAEFWMVEPEIAFAELDDDMELAESFIKYIFDRCLSEAAQDLAFFDNHIRKGTIKLLEDIISSPFEVLTYTEAVKILKNSGEPFQYPVEWGTDLQSEHERFLTERHVKKPVFVIDYPAQIKSFYMKLNDDGKTVRAMDCLVPGVGEIIGGSEREARYDVLAGRMAEIGLDPESYAWYLDSRRFGSVPHAGFGLGFERTVQFVTGMQNIRDVIPFPRTPGNAMF